MNEASAKKLIRELAAAGLVVFTRHGALRAKERGIPVDAVRAGLAQVLGVVAGERPNVWKASIPGPFTVVVHIQNGVIVVTVYGGKK